MSYIIHNGRKSMPKHLLFFAIIIFSTSFGSGQRLYNTQRMDPLDHLKIYRGGFNVTNIHYWSSTFFTGIYGYSIAVIWILCGVGYGSFLLAKGFNKSRKLKKRTCSPRRSYYPHYLLLTVFITLLVILGCGLVLGGNVKFHSQAKKIIDIVISAADKASTTVYSTAQAMRDIDNTLRETGGNPEAIEFLATTSQQLDVRAAEIARLVANHKQAISNVLRTMFIVTTMTFSLTLAFAVGLLVFGILRFRKTIIGLITVCWILTMLCWLFFGIYFFFHSVSGDACTALEDFQHNPNNNSLSSVLPCKDLLVAKSFLNGVSTGIYNLIDTVNKNISSSYGDIFQICNPFSPPPLYKYQPTNCPDSAIRIGNVPKVLRMLVCPDSEGKTCAGGILVPASFFNTVTTYSDTIQALLDAYPGMDSLVQCQPINDAFSEIVQHCKPLKRSIHIVWTSLIFLSVMMMTLILLWTIDAHHAQDHHSLGSSSVSPSSNVVMELEDGDVKTKIDKLQQV